MRTATGWKITLLLDEEERFLAKPGMWEMVVHLVEVNPNDIARPSDQFYIRIKGRAMLAGIPARRFSWGSMLLSQAPTDIAAEIRAAAESIRSDAGTVLLRAMPTRPGPSPTR